MISYFPHPYKDETVYSLIARYSQHIGIKSRYQIHNELMGKTMVSIKREYISNMENLSKKLKHFSNDYTSEYFIRGHTTFPFAAPFRTRDEHETENKHFLHRRRGSLSEVPSKEHLYYCSYCLKEQFQKNGEGYWQRLFQTQGVFVCYKHVRALNVHETKIVKQDLNKFEIPNPSLISVPEKNMDSVVLTKLAELTQNIDYFYNHSLDEVFIENITKLCVIYCNCLYHSFFNNNDFCLQRLLLILILISLHFEQKKQVSS
ncbi:TniQ family protein [Bacillus sp. REN3]|uniref:TniQ family protein n=1 Tax=Bacillus sp. REN3 TaxID=2802440 RepID=UPI001AEE3745|nr:TniQ family protein [Bacillus sp. REN3]